jgi:hypothetical protein
MKTRSFALAVTLLLMAFILNSTLMAQNKDSKQTEHKVKTTVQKIETKTGDTHQTAGTVQGKIENTKEGTKVVKSDLKNNTEKEMTKTKKEMKHHKMPTNKDEVKKPETKKH